MPNGQWGGLLTIVEDEQVSQRIDAECANYPRLREAWDALHWLLARSGVKMGRMPRIGNPNLRLYVQAHDLIAKIPAIWVLFELEQDQIVIHAINVVPVHADEE